jgi:hypothetical protein
MAPPSPRKTTATSRLEAARAALAEAEARVADIEAKRRAALLSDRDDEAVRLAGEIDQHRRLADGHAEKIRLLIGEAEEEANAARVKERLAHIERVEKLCAERDAAGRELAEKIPVINGLYRKLLDLGRRIDAGWPWPTGDRQSIAILPEHITAAVSHELFRLTARPRLGGGQNEHPDAGQRFPGSKPPNLGVMGFPESIMPLVDTLAAASKLASSIMRTGAHGRSTAPSPVPSTVNGHGSLSPAQIKLNTLLKRQAELAALPAMTPEQDGQYASLVQEISIIQTAIDSENGVRHA